jgi:hypothetical protein
MFLDGAPLTDDAAEYVENFGADIIALQETKIEDRRAEFDLRSSWRKDKEWQARRQSLEKEKREHFIEKPIPSDVHDKLLKILLKQPWHTAKSSPHQYVLLHKYIKAEGLDWDELMDYIAEYGFFYFAYGSWNQYLKVGDFFYFGNIEPRMDGVGICMLLNRRRVDNPPMSAYRDNFTGKWAEVGPVLMGYPQKEK